MKRKLEELIIALAYGELEGAEAESLLEQISQDPELRREYEAYRKQAELLNAVPPPPAPSFCSERLRDAVFQQTIRKQRALPALGVIGAVAAGLLTFVVVQQIATSTRSAPIADETPVVALQDLPAPHEWVPSLIEDIQGSVGSGTAEPTTKVDVAPPVAKQPAPAQRANKKRTPAAPTRSAPSNESAATPDSLNEPSPPAEDETVVILEDGGKAIEMEGTEGVAFGG